MRIVEPHFKGDAETTVDVVCRDQNSLAADCLNIGVEELIRLLDCYPKKLVTLDSPAAYRGVNQRYLPPRTLINFRIHYLKYLGRQKFWQSECDSSTVTQ